MNRPNQTQGGAKESVPQNIQMIALELAKAFRAFELYPMGHPQLKSMLSVSYEKILPELKKIGEIVFTVGREGIYFEGKLLTGLPALHQLTSELHIRQVRKFAFRPSLQLSEFINFLELLLIPAEEFRTGKKIENFFRVKQIRSIWVNEVDFGKLFTGQLIPEEEAQEEKESESQKFEHFNFLIEALDSASEDTQAETVLEKIEAEIEQLTGKDQFPEQWYLIGAVSDFLEQKGKIFPLSGQKAQALLKRFAAPQFLSWLVNKFMQTGEATGRAFHRYFEQVGEPVLKVMLERLMTPESIYFQKELIRYLRMKGKILTPMVQSLLASQKSAPNLKLVYLLGEFRLPENVPLLLELANRKDARDPTLKREAIRALGKIKSKQVNLSLASMLRTKNLDSETKLVLIQTLAEMQEIIAVPGLIALLKSRSEDLEVREKAAEALGRIGSREALPALSKILKKPLFFRRPAPEKVQLKAAEALAKIGGERAENLLRELAHGSGILAQHCQELIKQMESRKGGKK